MNPRTDTLNKAEQLINGDRNNQYGPPAQDFTRTANLWTTYLDGRTHLEAHDVAAMMILLKISRIRWSPEQHDHWIDIAGYAACGHDAYTSNDQTGNQPWTKPGEHLIRYQQIIDNLEEEVANLEQKVALFTGKTTRRIVKPDPETTADDWAKYYETLPSLPY